MDSLTEYAELQCRTHYSFLRGASHPEELVRRATELQLKALAITDLDGVYALPKAYRAIRELAKSFQGSLPKLIVGSELTLEVNGNPWPLTLLASNRAGYGLLCRLITASRADRPKGEAGLAWEIFLKLIAASENSRCPSSGLIALAKVDPSFQNYGSLKDIFSERLYFPVSRFLDGSDQERLRIARDLGQNWEIPIVATNEVHYHVQERRSLQDVLVSIRKNIPLNEVGYDLFSNAERHLKSPQAMAQLFHDFPEAIHRTIEIAERCQFSLEELRYRYPSEWIPTGETAQSYLERLTWQGAKKRYEACLGGIPEAVIRQLEHELRLIAELQFADYFLTIWEIVEFARSRQILCQGRGSAANSAVCYCLGITAIDPVRMNLLFERFLSAERGEPPDIDVDFEHERREEVIQHIYEKYGRDRAGMVSAIITYRQKSALRDVGKALDLDSEKLSESPMGQVLVQEIQGFPRHLSIHSGGFTLSADPIIETVPIEPARMEGRTIVQWDKEDLAIVGLLKVDILALGMLSALHKTFDLVKPIQELSLSTIPAEDLKTYQMIQRADTVGVFQIESRAQMSMLPRLLPKTFYDLVVQVAIVRPGPIVGQMVHPYLRRRNGLEPSKSPDPRLEPILSRTLGVPLFQEQVMKMAISMAGFTPGEADQLRRAIGAWRSSGEIEKMGMKLREGLLASGLPLEFVDRIFLQIQGFAEYGFPESHAASFALLAYASSYLKCHFPAEFTCALLNSQPMGFYSRSTLIEDAKRHGVEVRPLDPHHSNWDCTLEESSSQKRALRLGWCMVHGVGEKMAHRVIEERNQESFKSLQDFLTRTRLPPSVLHRLALGDAFASFGLERRAALWAVLDCWISKESSSLSGNLSGDQLDLFTQSFMMKEREKENVSKKPPFQALSDWDSVQADYRAYGLSVRGHPMGSLRKKLRGKIPSATSQTIRRLSTGQISRVAGLVLIVQRPPTAKGTAFATLEDENGFVDLVFRQEIFEKYRETLLENPFWVVSGKVQREGEAVSLLVNGVNVLDLTESSNKPNLI